MTLQKRVDGRWVSAASKKTAEDGSFTLKGTFRSVEVHRVRVVAAGDSKHLPGLQRHHDRHRGVRTTFS